MWQVLDVQVLQHLFWTCLWGFWACDALCVGAGYDTTWLDPATLIASDRHVNVEESATHSASCPNLHLTAPAESLTQAIRSDARKEVGVGWCWMQSLNHVEPMIEQGLDGRGQEGRSASRAVEMWNMTEACWPKPQLACHTHVHILSYIDHWPGASQSFVAGLAASEWKHPGWTCGMAVFFFTFFWWPVTRGFHHVSPGIQPQALKVHTLRHGWRRTPSPNP